MSLADKVLEQYTNEAKEEAVITLENDGFNYEIRIIDSTHISMKLVDSDSRPTIYQSYQAPDWVMAQLKKKGLVRGNKFFVVSDDTMGEAVSRKQHIDWYNNTFYPTLKKYASGDFDPMMVQSDGKGNFKVFTKMYKGSQIEGIKKAFDELGIKVVDFTTNASSYRGYVVGKKEGTSVSEQVDKKEINSILTALNAGGDDLGFKYPIGNKELTNKVKYLEQRGLIEYDDKYRKWKKK
jgi:hypothetical protein